MNPAPHYIKKFVDFFEVDCFLESYIVNGTNPAANAELVSIFRPFYRIG
jgi:hypothetical protein